MSRLLLLAVAIVTGAYALASWICGLLTDAGVAGAITGAIVIVAEGISYCERRNWERARRTRAEVWERRDAADVAIRAPGSRRPLRSIA